MKVEAVKYMVMAQDMEREIAFYKNVIGLVVNAKSEMWTELGFGDAISSPYTAGDPENPAPPG